MSTSADWGEIVTSLVDSIAWPLIVLMTLLMFHRPIRKLINHVSKIRHGDTEVHFDKKGSHDLDEQTVPKRITPLDTQPSLLSIRKLYGYLNYKGGSSNFWAFGIGTGDKINVTAYPFRELSNHSCWISLSGRPGPERDKTPNGTTIEYLLQEQLSPYSRNNPYRTTLTIPDFAHLTTPPCEGEITNIEIEAAGPVAFILEVIEHTR